MTLNLLVICGDRIICIVSILSVKVTIVFNVWIMINRSIRAVCSGICLQYRFPIFTCQNTHRVICFNPLSKFFKSVTGCISSFSCKLSLDKNRILFSLFSKLERHLATDSHKCFASSLESATDSHVLSYTEGVCYLNIMIILQ